MKSLDRYQIRVDRYSPRLSKTYPLNAELSLLFARSLRLASRPIPSKRLNVLVMVRERFTEMTMTAKTLFASSSVE